MSASISAVRKQLLTLQDLSYRDFHAKLMPTVPKERIIGIRTPILRKFAADFSKSDHAAAFLQTLPHYYYEENFSPKYPELVATVRSEEYYVNMMIAWYFATALVKQYDCILPFLTEQKLSPWVHNKTIQKAVES